MIMVRVRNLASLDLILPLRGNNASTNQWETDYHPDKMQQEAVAEELENPKPNSMNKSQP